MTRRAALAALLLAFALPTAARAQVEDIEQRPPSEHVEQRSEAPQIPSQTPAILTGEITTERFRILHTAKAAGAAKTLAADIERVRDLFVKTLGRDWPGVTEIRMGVGREEYEAIALPGGKPPSWSVALAYPSHNIVLLDALSLNSPTGSQTLRHELSHVALGQIGKDWPRWFQEGLAMHLTGERYSVTQYAALFRAVTQDRVFHFNDLRDSWPENPGDVEIAYAQSVAFVNELLEQFGPEKFAALLTAVGEGDRFEAAFARAFKSTLTVEEERWRKELPNRYSWWPVVTTTSTLLFVSALLTVIAWIRRKRHFQQRMDEMAAQEAAEDAAARVHAAAEAQQQAQLLSDAPPFPVDEEEEQELTPPPEGGAPPKPTIH